MKPSTSNKTLARQFRKILLYIISIILVIVGAFFISSEYREANKEIERYEKQVYAEKKRLLRNEVHEAISYINNQQRNIEKNMLNKLKNRVNEAHAQASHIYNSYHDKMSENQLKQLIIETLRPQRFFNGRGYYFIVSLKGKEILYPIHPEMEGKNVLKLQDKKGNYVIQEEIETVRKDEEGYVNAYWPAPGMPDTSAYKKTSFVKKFEPYDWYIGCGEYKINMVKEAQEKALERLEQIRYGKGGYIFVNTFDGKALLIHSEKYSSGDDITDMTDPNGVKIFKEELKAAKQPEGDFITYQWYEPEDYQYTENLTYVNSFDEWQWIVGAWVNLQVIKNDIAEKKEDINQQALMRIIILLVIIAITILAIYVIAGRLGRVINSNFNRFAGQLDSALSNYTLIDENAFKLYELKRLSRSTNKIISERNKATEKLSQSESELKTIFQHAPIMIAGINPDGSFEIYNQHIEATLGYTAAELKNFETAVNLLMKDVSEQQRALTNFKKKPGEFSEYHMRSKKGHDRIQYWATFKLFEDKTIIFGYDLTELKETQTKLQEREKELEELNATKDKFFSIIAHDLKNPLNALNGFASLLKEEYDEYSEEERKEIIQNIILSTENMSKLLQNLLEWSRSQMGRLSFNPEVFDIQELIKENVSLLNSQAASKHITLKHEGSGQSEKVFADKKMISTVLRNLISNAIKFTYPNGNVRIKTSRQNVYFKVEIEDDGTGMTRDEINKIFNIGEKYKKTGTSNEKGTGLGLILVKEFVEKNGGTLEVDSEIDKGSIFAFSVPGSSNEAS